MAEANFWYESNGEQKGPVTAAQLKGFAVSGELRPTDMIWKEGAPDWMTAGTVKGLFPEGTPGLAPPPPPASPPLQAKSSSQGMYGPAPDLRQATAAAKEASQEAIGAVKILFTDPIGGLGKAYESLGPSKALPVGIVFLVVFAVCLLASGFITGPYVPGMDIIPGINSFKYVSLAFVTQAVSVAAVIGLCFLIRTLNQSTASFTADLFVVGTAAVPLGLAVLVNCLLLKILQHNAFASALTESVMIFAGTLMVFLLFSGTTKIFGITERRAALWVPLMMIAAASVGILLWSLIAPNPTAAEAMDILRNMQIPR